MAHSTFSQGRGTNRCRFISMSAKSKKSSEAIDRLFDPQISNKAREIVQHYQVILSNEEGHWYGRGLELPHVFGDGASVDQCVAGAQGFR